MRILISGGAGYIGSLLTQYFLKWDHTVYSIDNLMYNNYGSVLPYLNNEKYTFIKGNVLNINSYSEYLNKSDVIIWLAALVGAPICEKDPNLAQLVNATSVDLLVKNLSPSQRLIIPNTNSGYGINSEGTCTEDSPITPISVYGKTKCMGEKYALEHKNCIALRLATVFGLSPRPRFDLMLNTFVAKLYFESKINLFEGHFKRNLIHINDICRAFIWFIDPKYTGIYNVGNDSMNLSKYEVACLVADNLNIKHDQIFNDENTKDPDQRNYTVSNKKLNDTFFKSKFSIEDGIKDILKLCQIADKGNIGKMGNVPIF